MKKFTSLLISCSLALAGAALAQKPDEQASPNPDAAVQKGKAAATDAKAKVHAAETKPAAAAQQHVPKNAPVPPKMDKAPTATKSMPSESAVKSAPATTTKTATDSATNAADSAATTVPATGKHAGKHGKDAKPSATDAKTAATATPSAMEAEKAKATPAPSATAAAKGKATPAPSATVAAKPTGTAAPSATAAPKVSATPAASTTPVTAASATPATSTAASAPVATPNPAAPPKPAPQQIQQIRTQQANFRAQPRPDRVPPVTYQENYRIQNSDRWQGQQYEVYRSYHPERHDHDWYHSHYQRVELVAGGYYFFNNGYWYPAWGYSPREEYYAYDAPIYVGHRAEPPDRIISEVQATLQQMGYYKGEVDGLLGPLTREALIGYQNDQGLVATAVMDQPTLDSLGMGS